MATARRSRDIPGRDMSSHPRDYYFCVCNRGDRGCEVYFTSATYFDRTGEHSDWYLTEFIGPELRRLGFREHLPGRGLNSEYDFATIHGLCLDAGFRQSTAFTNLVSSWQFPLGHVHGPASPRRTAWERLLDEDD